MPKFEYTHTTVVESSAVDEVHYNANTSKMAVDIRDTIYVYSGVPAQTYKHFVGPGSIGARLAEIKRDFGPSEVLGHYEDVGYRKVAESGKLPDMGAVGTPKDLTYAPSFTGTVQASNITLSHPEPKRNTSGQFAVTFEAGGKSRVHTLSAESFGAAEAAVLEIGTMLDLTFDVKEIHKV